MGYTPPPPPPSPPPILPTRAYLRIDGMSEKDNSVNVTWVDGVGTESKIVLHSGDTLEFQIAGHPITPDRFQKNVCTYCGSLNSQNRDGRCSKCGAPVS